MPRIHFHQQLAGLKDKLLAMAALAQESVRSAVEAYLRRDENLCKLVKRTERAIDTAQRELDEKGRELLAQQHPIAIDLRFVLAVLKINRDLERIGDLAMNIRRRTKDILEIPPVELPVDFAAMEEVVSHMMRLAVQALLEGDTDLADSIRRMDDDIDRMNQQAFESLLEFMQTNPQYAQQATAGILVAKNLERIADHVSNIAVDVIFWIRGADVRHELDAAPV